MAPVIIAAHPMETAALVQSAAGIDTWHFGVGAINAAQHAAPLAEKCRGRDVIYIGTAGLFGVFSEPKLYIPTEVTWQDYGIRCQQSYIIEGDLPALPLVDRLPLAAFDQLSTCRVVCSASISKTAEPPPKGAGCTDVLENVELYSVAGPIGTCARSFTAVLATTNSVGPHAHQQWRQHAELAAQLTSEFLTQNILRKGV